MSELEVPGDRCELLEGLRHQRLIRRRDRASGTKKERDDRMEKKIEVAGEGELHGLFST